MRKQITITVLLFIAMTLCIAQTTIAVIDFDARGISEYEVATLTDRFRDELIKTNQYTVIERGKMEEVLKEQGFQQSGCASDECVVEVGQLIGVEQMVGGSIGKVGNVFTLSARIIDVESGSILNVTNYDHLGDIGGLLTVGMRNAAQQLLEGISNKPSHDEDEVAVISTQFGDMVISFFPEVAPMHVENFKEHVQNGYYDGTTFHRIIPGFIIQGGDPNTKDNDKQNDGAGGRASRYYGIGNELDVTEWTLPAEFNDRPHLRGALSMARAQDPNSAGSQFFICVDDVRRLDNLYTVFGEVIKGMEVADKIVRTERDERDNPIEKVTMIVKLIPRQTIEVE